MSFPLASVRCERNRIEPELNTARRIHFPRLITVTLSAVSCYIVNNWRTFQQDLIIIVNVWRFGKTTYK